MSDLVSRLLAAIAETERAEKRKRNGSWFKYDPCPQCGQPTYDYTFTFGGEGESAVVEPCGHELTAEQAKEFLWATPAEDPAVLRRCAADRRQVERLAEMVRLGEEYYDNPTVWDLVQDCLKDFATGYDISVGEEMTGE